MYVCLYNCTVKWPYQPKHIPSKAPNTCFDVALAAKNDGGSFATRLAGEVGCDYRSRVFTTADIEPCTTMSCRNVYERIGLSISI